MIEFVSFHIHIPLVKTIVENLRKRHLEDDTHETTNEDTNVLWKIILAYEVTGM